MAGYHGRGGPAPDPHALRRDRPSDAAGWVTLSAEGRTDPAPEWPLAVPASPAELTHWAREWARPQAIQWEAQGQEVEVALYIRCLAEAEIPGAATSLRVEVRQRAEHLGLSLPGLARHRWRIATRPAGTVTPLRPVGGSRRDRSGTADTPALDLLAKWREHGATFGPDTTQHADAAAELAARGIDLDPYEYLDRRGA